MSTKTIARRQIAGKERRPDKLISLDTMVNKGIQLVQYRPGILKKLLSKLKSVAGVCLRNDTGACNH